MIPWVLLAYNVVVALAYGFDKRRAQTGGRRVPERRLLLLAAAFGGAGAWLGMKLFRHKTRKPVFRIAVPALLLLQLGLAGALSEPGRRRIGEAMGWRSGQRAPGHATDGQEVGSRGSDREPFGDSALRVRRVASTPLETRRGFLAQRC